MLALCFVLLCIVLNAVVVVTSDPLWSKVCQANHASAGLPFCDFSLSIEERVKDYTSRIPVESQISMMGNRADGYSPLGIPPYQWWSEGLHGAMEPCVQLGNKSKCPTSFPSPSGLGNAFNSSLYRLIGEAIGKEGRAISQLRNHDTSIGDGLTYWSPNVNLQRDPRWGRNQEAPGEDPVLTSIYAKQFIRGLQSSADHKNSTKGGEQLQVAAACKHFVANSLENWMGVTRHTFDAIISEEDLHEYYLVPFRECVISGAAGIMCSYNSVNGIPACLHAHLQRSILRERWGFEGYLVTDCGALVDTYEGHGYVENAKQASALAKNSTVDVNCGDTFQKGLLDAFRENRVSSSTLMESFQRMATIQFRLGLFDSKSSDQEEAFHAVGSHRKLALDAARQSIVLMKNQVGVLPLERDMRVALIGPHIDGREVFVGNYHGAVCRGEDSFSCIESPREAFEKASSSIPIFLEGCHVSDEDLDEIQQAAKAAQQVDRIVLMLGLDQTQESEGKDRVLTTLPGLQKKLLRAVLDVAADKTVIVLVHGGSVSLGHDAIQRSGAILSASYGGAKASQALVDVLFGAYNPTGKLSSTVYPPEYVEELPLTEMSLTEGPGRTHIYYTGLPEFSFGHGLSYSDWELEWNDFSPEDPVTIGNWKSLIQVRVSVTNHGPWAGSQRILLFWVPVRRQRMQETLLGFEGTQLLSVGQSQIVTFEVHTTAFEVGYGLEENFPSTDAVIGALEARGSNRNAINRPLVRFAQEEEYVK